MTKPHVRDDPNPSWNMMAHGDTREVKWWGKLANGVGSQYSSHYLGTWCIQHYYRWCAHIGWTDAPRRFKWTRPFRRKTKSGFCACAITFQLASTVICTLPEEFSRPTADYFFVLISISSMDDNDVTSFTISSTSLEQIPCSETKRYSRKIPEIFLPFMVNEGYCCQNVRLANKCYYILRCAAVTFSRHIIGVIRWNMFPSRSR